MSYAHADDKYEHVSRFRQRLSDEVAVLIGVEFPIFQDSIHIHWGEDWKSRIKQSLDEVVLLIPILTPSFFHSSVCREEVALFLQREKALKRNDLILPVYFVDCDVLNIKVELEIDALAQEISKHQRADWRSFRLKPFDSPEVDGALEGLARGIKNVLQRRVMHRKLVKRPAKEPDFSTYRLPPNLQELISDLVSRLDLQQPKPRIESKSGDDSASKPSAVKERAKSKGRPSRSTALKSSSRHYEKSVFISAPFGDFYQPMFEAVVFAVTVAGFTPRSVFETPVRSRSRLDGIMKVIAKCKYGVFDISNIGLTKGLPRFNTPLELGLFLGGWKYGGGLQKKKSVLVLERDPHRYKQFISDLAGHDIEAHSNRPSDLIKIVRDWLAISSNRTIPSGSEIYRQYRLFKRVLPKICRQIRVTPGALTYSDYTYVIATWLKEYGVAGAR